MNWFLLKLLKVSFVLSKTTPKCDVRSLNKSKELELLAVGTMVLLAVGTMVNFISEKNDFVFVFPDSLMSECKLATF